MSLFICPVCKKQISEEEKNYKCENGHCFDKSKFGYVNLLQSQKSSAKRHGDDRLMVRARRDFLSVGYYGFLRDALYNICKSYLIDGDCVVDAGCGECWYSSGIKEKLLSENKNIDFYGIDISKDALEFAGKRKSGIPCAVASAFDMPFANETANLILNVFSPAADEEFLRVLRKEGVLIRVIPLEKHLFNLKAVIYDKPYENDVPDTNIDGFSLAQKIKLCREIHITSNSDIQNLFKMTPYYYKTGVEDQKKINDLTELKTQANFEIRVYLKTV